MVSVLESLGVQPRLLITSAVKAPSAIRMIIAYLSLVLEIHVVIARYAQQIQQLPKRNVKVYNVPPGENAKRIQKVLNHVSQDYAASVKIVIQVSFPRLNAVSI